MAYKNATFREMQFWAHCYTVVSYQALFRLSVNKIPAIYLSGAKNVRFCTIRDFGSPTNTYFHAGTGLCTSFNKVTYLKYSFNKLLEYLLLYVLPNDTKVILSICITVVGYTCIKSVSEFRKFIRLK